MKLSNLRFLTKANIKGNKNSGTITVLICMLVVAVTVISCFSVVTVSTLNESKSEYRARALFLSPYLSPLTDEAIKVISSVEHVEVVDDATALYGQCAYNITKTNDDELNSEISKHKDTYININGLYEHEHKNVIKGESLENTPVFSCLVPSIFYPFEEDEGNIHAVNLDYMDGTKLVGKTITVKGYNGTFTFPYNIVSGNIADINIDANLNSPEFTFKVVGTYYCSYATSGYYGNIFVSRETSLLMTKMAIENAGIDLSADEHDIAVWWNTPSIHNYLVVADDYNNINEVFNSVNKMGYDIASSPESLIMDSTVLVTNLFSTVGVFLIAAITVISIVILAQSSVSAIRERKGYIGLMKAVGYKNRQVFFCLCCEQLYLTLRAFIIGGAISALIVTITNLIFKHGAYAQMIYVIDWNMFFVFLGISFMIAAIVPLIFQTVLLKRLIKIQPRDAMTAN